MQLNVQNTPPQSEVQEGLGLLRVSGSGFGLRPDFHTLGQRIYLGTWTLIHLYPKPVAYGTLIEPFKEPLEGTLSPQGLWVTAVKSSWA